VTSRSTPEAFLLFDHESPLSRLHVHFVREKGVYLSFTGVATPAGSITGFAALWMCVNLMDSGYFRPYPGIPTPPPPPLQPGPFCTGMRALDIGCGPGAVSLMLSKRVGSQGHVFAVDRNPKCRVLTTLHSRFTKHSTVSHRGSPDRVLALILFT